MKEQSYIKISEYIKKRTLLYRCIKILCEGLPKVVVVAFFIGIIYLGFMQDVRIVRFIAVPAALFATVTVIRKIYKSKRPYEVYNITPLVKKDKKGESMPSRHTASAVVIACAFLYISIPLGISFIVISAVIGLTRVLCGVHFPADVIVGSVLSVIFSVVGFVLI